MVERPARTIAIDEVHAGRSLDKFLRYQLKGVPAGLLFQLMRKGKLRVNGRRVEQNYRLVEGDEIAVPPLRVEERATPAPRPRPDLLAQLKNTVVYEDADLLVVNKPAGVAVHRGTDVHAGVIEGMRHLRPDLPELELGHRLDRDTSGVLVLAKRPPMLRHLHEMLRDREDEIGRHYMAVVAGGWPTDLRVLDAPLRRRSDRVVVHPAGQRAETHVSVRRQFERRSTLIDVRLLTGRKHQIRVHLAHAGHPIVGDDRYGDPDVNQMASGSGVTGLHLHAARMVIPMPDGRKLEVVAPTPGSWQRLLRSGI